jgi:peptide/nickel transport system permease protein
MTRYILKRIILMIPILIGASFLVYFIMSLTPGFDNPGRIILGMDAQPEAVEKLNSLFGADKPFFERFLRYIGGIMRGGFGLSYRTQQSVSGEILRRFPATLTLALSSIIFSLLVGIPIGIISAVRQYRLSDYISRVVSMVMTAIPSFWLGLMLLLLFGLKLKWFPTSGIERWQGFVLPSLSLSIISMGMMIRMTRSAMLEVVRQDYIRTARAKGMKESAVIIKHALRNARSPVITVAGVTFGTQLGGAVIIETVFAVPGLGTYILSAVNNRDLPCVLGAVILLASAFSIINLSVDIAYTFVDPRIKSLYTSLKGRGFFGALAQKKA